MMWCAPYISVKNSEQQGAQYDIGRNQSRTYPNLETDAFLIDFDKEDRLAGQVTF